ncbi:MAG: oligopeptide transport system substrate-binding protein, partial [Granulosicoccus sp.]
MIKSFKSTLYVLLGSSLVLSSAIASNRVPTDVKLADDQTFTYRILDEHSSVDPQVVEDVTGSEVVRDLFEGLMNQDSEGNLIPGVATAYDVNDDNTVYTFKLRDNAKWSTGEAVTASDFVYAWQRAVDPELASPYQWFMELMSIDNAAEIIKGDKTKEELGVKAID